MGHSRGQVLIIARLEPSTLAPVLSSRVPEVPPLLLSRIQIPHNTERGCWPRGLNSAPICNAFAWSFATNAKWLSLTEPGFCFPIHPRFLCIRLNERVCAGGCSTLVPLGCSL